MADKQILDFRQQAEQMVGIIDTRLKSGQRRAAVEFLVLKFKTLFEQGIASGRLYERDGIYPFEPMDKER